MNILSHILNYETKNLFIDNILEKIKTKLTNALFSVLSNFSKNRYITSFLNLQKEVNNLIVELIIDFISLVDETYKNYDERKNDYYINKSNVTRTIYTIYGEITFERTLYICKHDSKKYYYFVDQILGIEAYNLYDPIVRGIAINDAVNYNPNNASYHSSLDSLDVLNSLNRNGIGIISRQSIYRWIRNCKAPSINYDPINNESTLYIMAD